MKFFVLFVMSLMFIQGCGSSDSEPAFVDNPTRSFRLGFTPWLYEASFDAQDITYTRLTEHGDIIKHHLMSGIPWQEALDQTAYHANVEGEIQGRLDRTPNGMKVFLAIDVLNSGRDALVPNWGESVNMPLSGDWATRSWSSPEVITAYTNFARDMIQRFQPTHFEYGTEVSELIINDRDAYLDFLIFAEAVYAQLKVEFPALKLMTSVAMKSPASLDMQTIEADMDEVMPYTDVLGISTYPYVFFNHADRGDPANLPENWLSQITAISGSKPLAISETGWIGEDLDISDFSYAEMSDPQKQAAYTSVLLQAAQNMEMDFVIWWAVSDFDTLWNDTLGQDPLAKIWKDIGFYDESQTARIGLQTWNEWFDKSYTE